MNFDAIKVHSAPEVLAEQILGQIRSGKLEPGECLPSQRELARMFAVGLGTVREALKILDVMGCVDVLRGKGSFVAENVSAILAGTPRLEDALEAVSLAELMKAREVVETGAAGLAAKNADADNIRRLREITSRMISLNASSETYYENDFNFHIAVAEAAQNQAILEIVKLLVGKTHTHTSFMDKTLGISLPAEMKQCGQSAVRVVDWIEKSDVERAANEMRAHLNIVTVNLKQQFPK